jgi:uncharacterized damage-inducible protein DinB
MDAGDFCVLYEYNAWANRRILDACAVLTREQFLQDMKSSFPSVRDTLAHIYRAEIIWFERWHSRPLKTLPNASDFETLDQVRDKLPAMDRELVDFAYALTSESLSRELHYRMFDGTEHSGPLAPTMQHLVNHSSYHRGQVTTMLRQHGAKAVTTDLIAYHRELKAKATA